FLRLSDGRLALTAPRGLYSWLTDGWYYRLLDIAIARGHRDAFTTYVGFLFEEYVVELLELALPNRASGDGRVNREQTYRGEKTADAAIDYGADLLLVEVVSTRLPRGVRAEANAEELDRFLRRAVLDK